MPRESFKPIPVQKPSASPLGFWLRQVVDLQLMTIVRPLRPAMRTLTGKVLDVGAGEAPWREWLPAGATYQGVDIENADDFGMVRADDITYYDGRTLPFADATFDATLCIEVLEHAEDPEKLMAEMGRCLRKGGLLILTVPWSARRHHIPNDFHRFTRERLAHLLGSHGFIEVSIDERGNDIAAIASKLVVLSLRLAPGPTWRRLLSLPLFLALAPVTAVFVVVAHMAVRFHFGAPEDPLGYFVRATRN
jgi:SAM-dependent methyltransferase